MSEASLMKLPVESMNKALDVPRVNRRPTKQKQTIASNLTLGTTHTTDSSKARQSQDEERKKESRAVELFDYIERTMYLDLAARRAELGLHVAEQRAQIAARAVALDKQRKDLEREKVKARQSLLAQKRERLLKASQVPAVVVEEGNGHPSILSMDSEKSRSLVNHSSANLLTSNANLMSNASLLSVGKKPMYRVLSGDTIIEESLGSALALPRPPSHDRVNSGSGSVSSVRKTRSSINNRFPSVVKYRRGGLLKVTELFKGTYYHQQAKEMVHQRKAETHKYQDMLESRRWMIERGYQLSHQSKTRKSIRKKCVDDCLEEFDEETGRTRRKTPKFANEQEYLAFKERYQRVETPKPKMVVKTEAIQNMGRDAVRKIQEKALDLIKQKMSMFETTAKHKDKIQIITSGQMNAVGNVALISKNWKTGFLHARTETDPLWAGSLQSNDEDDDILSRITDPVSRGRRRSTTVGGFEGPRRGISDEAQKMSIPENPDTLPVIALTPERGPSTSIQPPSPVRSRNSSVDSQRRRSSKLGMMLPHEMMDMEREAELEEMRIEKQIQSLAKDGLSHSRRGTAAYQNRETVEIYKEHRRQSTIRHRQQSVASSVNATPRVSTFSDVVAAAKTVDENSEDQIVIDVAPSTTKYSAKSAHSRKVSDTQVKVKESPSKSLGVPDHNRKRATSQPSSFQPTEIKGLSPNLVMSILKSSEDVPGSNHLSNVSLEEYRNSVRIEPRHYLTSEKCGLEPKPEPARIYTILEPTATVEEPPRPNWTHLNLHAVSEFVQTIPSKKFLRDTRVQDPSASQWVPLRLPKIKSKMVAPAAETFITLPPLPFATDSLNVQKESQMRLSSKLWLNAYRKQKVEPVDIDDLEHPRVLLDPESDRDVLGASFSGTYLQPTLPSIRRQSRYEVEEDARFIQMELETETTDNVLYAPKRGFWKTGYGKSDPTWV